MEEKIKIIETSKEYKKREEVVNRRHTCPGCGYVDKTPHLGIQQIKYGFFKVRQI